MRWGDKHSLLAARLLARAKFGAIEFVRVLFPVRLQLWGILGILTSHTVAHVGTQSLGAEALAIPVTVPHQPTQYVSSYRIWRGGVQLQAHRSLAIAASRRCVFVNFSGVRARFITVSCIIFIVTIVLALLVFCVVVAALRSFPSRELGNSWRLLFRYDAHLCQRVALLCQLRLATASFKLMGILRSGFQLCGAILCGAMLAILR